MQPNLTELGLVDNNITDISPLTGLTKLKLLWLTTTQYPTSLPLQD